jgi:hypothetical protein
MNAKKNKKATGTVLTARSGVRNMVSAERGLVDMASGVKRNDGRSMGMSVVRRGGLRKGGRTSGRREEMSIVRKGGRTHTKSVERIMKREEKITRRGGRRGLMTIEVSQTWT